MPTLKVDVDRAAEAYREADDAEGKAAVAFSHAGDDRLAAGEEYADALRSYMEDRGPVTVGTCAFRLCAGVIEYEAEPGKWRRATFGPH